MLCTMAVNNVGVQTAEQKQMLLKRYSDIEWCDNADNYRCCHCKKVAIHHYVSNCKHLFCNNCRNIVDDGTAKFKCPKCKRFIAKAIEQDVDIERRIGQLKIYCPNMKYGCKHKSQLINITEHLKECVDTREAALPVRYTGTNTMGMLYDFVGAMNEKLQRLIEQVTTIESSCENRFNKMEEKFESLENIIKDDFDSFTKDFDDFDTDLAKHTQQIQTMHNQIKGKQSADQAASKFEKLKEEIDKLKVEQQKVSEDNLEVVSEMKSSIKSVLQQNDKALKFHLGQQEVSLRQSINDCKIHFGKKSKQQDDKLQNLIKERQIMDQLSQKVDKLKMEMDSFKWHQQKVSQENSEFNSNMKSNVSLLQRNFSQQALSINDYQVQLEQKTKQLTEKLSKQQSSIESNRDQLDRIKADTQTVFKLIPQLSSQIDQVETKFALQIKAETIRTDEIVATKIDDIYIDLNRLKSKQATLADKGVDRMSVVNEWNIAGFAMQLFNSSEIHSIVFQLPEYSFSARARINTYTETGIYISLQLLDPKTYKTPVNVKPMPKFTLVPKCEGERQDTQKFAANAHCEFSPSTENGEWIYNEIIYISFLTEKIDILIEAPSVAHSFFSNNGVLLWRVDNYKLLEMRKHKAMNGIDSPYFYTSPQGYRVLLRLKISETNFLYAHLYFLTSENDYFLTKEYSHKLTITLFNRLNRSRNLEKTEKGREAVKCSVILGRWDLLEKEGLIKDDSILLKAVVEPRSWFQ